MKQRLITLWRIVHSGIVNFIRNATLAVAAIAVMVVTLTIVLFSVIANATFENTIQQITNKISVSVYLSDGTTDAQAKQLVTRLKQQPEVEKVVYLDKQQALQSYVNQNKSNQNLVVAATESGNPIPATIQVYPQNLNDVQAIKDYLVQPDNKKLQTADSPSYNGDRKEAIDNITHATNVLRKIGIVTVAVFAVICALIIFNTIQMAIFNRRSEIQIMRLLGAGTAYIRGPFVVESAIYGLVSAIFSVLIVNSVFLASSGALQASSLGLLDIHYANEYFGNHFWILLLMQIAIGIIIGTVSSIIATRRYLKFKSK
ncbi:MAG TPA: permease-like cell division protein FtsX [Candidatus Saccharimonadales bacterium]|nr:permease-like cell division protein FtsX [Candidatus Saccharimonadales bacterium]